VIDCFDRRRSFLCGGRGLQESAARDDAELVSLENLNLYFLKIIV